MSRQPDLFDDPALPFQRHSRTSRRGAKKPSAARATAQERWVYETLRANVNGLADWQLWKLAIPTGHFEQLSSVRRARIGLLWVSKRRGGTPYHPVEDSGGEAVDPKTGMACTVWWIKPLYRDMIYEQWVERYKAMAREEH